MKNSNQNVKKFSFTAAIVKNSSPYNQLHSHPGEVEIQYVFSGEGIYMINNKLYPVREGTLLLINKHEYHRISGVNKKKPLFKACIVFSTEIFTAYGELKQFVVKTLAECRKKKIHLLQFEKNEAVETGMIVKGLQKDAAEKNSSWKESVVLEMGKLCVLIQKNLARPQEAPKQIKNAIIQGCLDYIDKNIASDLSLKNLSTVTGLATNYLSAKFSVTAGISIKDYIIEKRISEAKKKLELNPEVKIIEIAFEAGFKDLSNFNHTFKKLTGYTPSDYRRISLK